MAVRNLLILSENDISRCIIYLGTPGPYRKLAVLQLDEQYRPLAISKVATNSTTHNLLANERKILERVSKFGLLLGHVPQVLQSRSKDGLYALKQTIGMGKALKAKTNSGQVIVFLKKLHIETGRRILFEDSGVSISLHRRYNQLNTLLSADWRQRYKHCLLKIDTFTGQKFNFVLAHRDFVRWNMCLSENGIFVFDWEYSEDGYPPLYDYFHYLLMPKAVKGRLNKKILKKTIIKAKEYPWCDEGDTIPYSVQLLIYLLDLCSTYLEANKGKDQGDLVISQYADMIDCSEEWAK
jgi:hypothetical protein